MEVEGALGRNYFGRACPIISGFQFLSLRQVHIGKLQMLARRKDMMHDLQILYGSLRHFRMRCNEKRPGSAET